MRTFPIHFGRSWHYSGLKVPLELSKNLANSDTSVQIHQLFRGAKNAIHYEESPENAGA